MRYLRAWFALLFAVSVAAGSAFGDPPPWAGRGERDRVSSQPALVGTVASDYRRGRQLEVRSGRDTYRVDLSRATVRGADSGRIDRGTRVLVWGSRVSDRAIRATRVQVLGGDNDRRFGVGDRPRASNNRYTLTGEVTRRSSAMSTRNIRVSARGTEWFVEVPKEVRVIRGRDEISIHEVPQGSQVRVEGVRIDRANHILAERILVLDWRDVRRDDRRDDRRDGLTAYEGSVRDVDARDGKFRMRLNRFETVTVHAGRDTDIVRGGRRASLNDLREDTRVRVHGRLDSRAKSLDARRVEIL